jgi:RNA polymerase sigma-70 factor (ECF subfamily)
LTTNLLKTGYDIAMTLEADLTTEIRLAEQVAGGDERAFRDFYERYADPLYLFIYHLMNSAKEDAEEVWQDSLMAAMNGMAGYRGESRLFSWLCAIARRKAVDFYRRAGRGGAQPVLELSEVFDLPDETPLPEEVLANRAVRARVVEVLENMPPDYRESLTARYAQGLSVEQISANLRKSYKATESLLSRARQAFKEAFAGSGDESHGR